MQCKRKTVDATVKLTLVSVWELRFRRCPQAHFKATWLLPMVRQLWISGPRSVPCADQVTVPRSRLERSRVAADAFACQVSAVWVKE